jgi:hypothetical protein
VDSCCRQYYTAESDGSPASHEEMFLFLALILKMGLSQHDTLKQHQSRKPMCHARSIPVPCGLIDFFTSTPMFWKLDAPNSNREFYDRSWKLRRDFNYPNARFTNAYDVCGRWGNCKILVQDGFLLVYSKKREIMWHKFIQIMWQKQRKICYVQPEQNEASQLILF